MASVLGELPIMKKSMLGQRGPGCGAGGGPWTGRPAGDVVLTTGRPRGGETEAAVCYEDYAEGGAWRLCMHMCMCMCMHMYVSENWG